eukprot:8360612-Pyramimonas_sp.AAC.1
MTIGIGSETESAKQAWQSLADHTVRAHPPPPSGPRRLPGTPGTPIAREVGDGHDEGQPGVAKSKGSRRPAAIPTRTRPKGHQLLELTAVSSAIHDEQVGRRQPCNIPARSARPRKRAIADARTLLVWYVVGVVQAGSMVARADARAG